MCNAICRGVHPTRLSGEKVACGATAPRGNNPARSRGPPCRRSSSCAALKKAGARFDVYAHHPYYSGPSETPSAPPPGPRAVTLGNINDLCPS